MPLNNSPALTGKAATIGQLTALLEKYSTIDDRVAFDDFTRQIAIEKKATRKERG